MKRFISLIGAVVAVVAALYSVTPAGAAEDQVPKAAEDQSRKQVMVKVAILDTDRIRRAAKVYKDIDSQARVFRGELLKAVQKEEDELRKANQDLARQRSILSADAFAEKRREFEKRLIDLQSKVSVRKRKMEIALESAHTKAQGVVNETVRDVANEGKFTLIFNTKQLVIWAKPLEITQIILDRLDERLSSLKLDLPKDGG